MIRYLLDTDVLSKWQVGTAEVVAVIEQYPIEELATTIITVEEQLDGWHAALRQARSDERNVYLYERMTATVQFLAGVEVVTYSLAAVRRYKELRKLRLNAGNTDLKIAAIALESGSAVITSNVRDFRRVPGLDVILCP